MGEAKRREQAKSPFQLEMDRLMRSLTDQGRIVEAGWIALRAVWLPPEAPEQQVRDCRWAYMAGAQHLFASIMSILEPDEDPTTADLRRMDLINEELAKFQAEVEASLPGVRKQ